MAIPEEERARGVGRTSSVYPRNGDGVNLEVTGVGASAPPHISRAINPAVLSTYEERTDAVGPAKRMLQGQGEFSASFTTGRENLPTTTTTLSTEDMVKAAEAQLRSQRRKLRKGNGVHPAVSEQDKTMFVKAATEGFVPDKDLLGDLDPALRVYERELQRNSKLDRVEIRQAAKGAKQALAPVAFEAANTAGVRKPSRFDSLMAFLRAFAPNIT